MKGDSVAESWADYRDKVATPGLEKLSGEWDEVVIKFLLDVQERAFYAGAGWTAVTTVRAPVPVIHAARVAMEVDKKIDERCSEAERPLQ